MKQKMNWRFAVITLSFCLAGAGLALASGKKGLSIPPAPAQKRVDIQSQPKAPTPILGEAVLPKEQAVAFIVRVNPAPKLNCSVEEIVHYYYEEAAMEGVRADLALSQALLETGFFRYGGDVKPEQNNFCGLGTTGGGIRGAAFPDPRTGVRAHIQHLLAYSTRRLPQQEIVDPRYHLVWQMPNRYAKHPHWEDLDGLWATSRPYSAKIFSIYERMLSTPFTAPADTPTKEAAANRFIILSPEARGL